MNKISQITDKIIQENAESLEILRLLADGKGISLPPATRDQKVDLRVSRDRRTKHRLPVKVKIHYMIGNHDWYYRLPGPGFDQVRQKIIDVTHISNQESPFPYEPCESGIVEQVLSQHSVFGRRVDFYDSYNLFKKERNHASLGDALCVELFNRVGVQIKSELQGKLPEALSYASLPLSTCKVALVS